MIEISDQQSLHFKYLRNAMPIATAIPYNQYKEKQRILRKTLELLIQPELFYSAILTPDGIIKASLLKTQMLKAYALSVVHIS